MYDNIGVDMLISLNAVFDGVGAQIVLMCLQVSFSLEYTMDQNEARIKTDVRAKLGLKSFGCFVLLAHLGLF